MNFEMIEIFDRILKFSKLQSKLNKFLKKRFLIEPSIKYEYLLLKYSNKILFLEGKNKKRVFLNIESIDPTEDMYYF